jgi:hypothetical protein
MNIYVVNMDLINNLLIVINKYWIKYIYEYNYENKI